MVLLCLVSLLYILMGFDFSFQPSGRLCVENFAMPYRSFALQKTPNEMCIDEVGLMKFALWAIELSSSAGQEACSIATNLLSESPL